MELGSRSVGTAVATPMLGVALPAISVAIGYFIGAKIGFALTPPSIPVSILWPANAILLGGLLRSPRRCWWWILLAVIPAHLAAQAQVGVPTPLILGWLVSNCAEALLGAAVVWRILDDRPDFSSMRDASAFLCGCVLFAACATTFLDIAMVQLATSARHDFWTLWRARFFSDVLAMLAFVPVLLTWPASLREWLHGHGGAGRLEAGLLLFLLGVSYVGGLLHEKACWGCYSPLWLYVPLPILCWAAIRFNPFISAVSYLVFVLVTASSAQAEMAPLAAAGSPTGLLGLQLYLIVTGIALLLLSVAIRERRAAQESLSHKEDILHQMARTTRIGIWELDAGSNMVTCWPGLQGLFGMEGHDHRLPLERLLIHVHPDDIERARSVIRDSFLRTQPFELEFRIRGERDTACWLATKGRPVVGPGRVRILCTTVDVTEKKHAEEVARMYAASAASEQRLRSLTDVIPQLVWAARPDGFIDYTNFNLQRITGGALLHGYDSLLPYLHPDERERYRHRWQNALAAGTSFETECRLRFPAIAGYGWYLIRAAPLHDRSGCLLGWCGTATEINEQKQAERIGQLQCADLERRFVERTLELGRVYEGLRVEFEWRRRATTAERVSQERFAQIFRLSPDAMSISSSATGPLLEVNRRWEELFGYSREEACGRTPQELLLYRTEQDFAAVNESCHLPGMVCHVDVDMRDRKGRILHTTLSGAGIGSDDDRCFIAIIRDLTAQRHAEAEAQHQREQLTHLSRVVVLGELSGAFAHELNQPLAAILTNAQAAHRFLARSPPDLNEVAAILEDIVAEDKRAGEVIRRLRALFLKGDPVLGPVDINELVRDSIRLARSSLVERQIKVLFELSAHPATVRGDRVQLQQVLLNLVINASEAMTECNPARRCLRMETSASRPGGLQILVSDSGKGIEPAVLERIFEPFFTTKRHGLGFGLSISRAIIDQHGGQLDAHNNEAGGSTFTITLPIYREGSHE